MNPFPDAQLEIVKWKDAVGDTTRTHYDEIDKLHLATNINVGWVIREDDELIVLAHGRSDTNEADHLTIPANCILERQGVSSGRKKKKSRSK